MDKIEYTKRLEEILDEQFKRLDGTTVLPIYNRPTAVGQAITAIQQLNNEAIGKNKKIRYDDWKDNVALGEATNKLRQELRAVIGASND